MDIDQLDIDWEYVIQRLDRILELGEEYLTRRLSEYELDPTIFRHYLAFRWIRQGDDGYLAEVAFPNLPDHAELFGIDQILERLRQNTEQFVHSYPANNVLLWGEQGAGKSSSIKGLLKLFAPHGLRLIEVREEDLFQLPQITALVREQPYRFILYCDDLSFDGKKTAYRELNTLLDGGLEEPPANILIYATSDSRRLRLEQPSDDIDAGEVGPEEAMAEIPSPADRFGISLGFHPISQQTYLQIVEHLAHQRRLLIDNDELNRAALHWSQERCRLSGRVARQFIDDLSGRLAMAGKIAPLSS